MRKTQLSIILLIITIGTFLGYSLRILPPLLFWAVIIIIAILTYKVVPKMKD